MKPSSEIIVEKEQPCPLPCGSSDAYFLYGDGHGHCYSCGYHYFPSKEFIELNDNFSYQYLDYRGINSSTYKRYKAQTKIDGDGKPVSIGYPHREEGVYKVRSLNEKKFHYVGDVKRGCFGVDKFVAGSNQNLIITEGYEDALSCNQVCRCPAISVQSSGTAAADCSVDRAWINTFDRIYLAFDADERGREAASAVAKLFDYGKVYELKFPGGDRKDANDFLRNGAGDDLLNLFRNAKKYLPDTIVSSYAAFDKIIREVPKVGVPYPFPTLTYMTYGIRTGETVLLTAQ